MNYQTSRISKFGWVISLTAARKKKQQIIGKGPCPLHCLYVFNAVLCWRGSGATTGLLGATSFYPHTYPPTLASEQILNRGTKSCGQRQTSPNAVQDFDSERISIWVKRCLSRGVVDIRSDDTVPFDMCLWRRN